MQESQATAAKRAIDPNQVTGWGVDADTENDPTYPMKTHVEGEHEGYSWDRPEQQSENVEVLSSTERPNLPSAFGTTLPPSGVSGMIRRAAFNYSENSYAHWPPLMLADRVQIVEGVVDDLAHGHVPNIFKELGWKADWKYDRKAFVTKLAIGTGVVVGLGLLLNSMSKSRSSATPDD
jgi:hypothetical protein